MFFELFGSEKMPRKITASNAGDQPGHTRTHRDRHNHEDLGVPPHKYNSAPPYAAREREPRRSLPVKRLAPCESCPMAASKFLLHVIAVVSAFQLRWASGAVFQPHGVHPLPADECPESCSGMFTKLEEGKDGKVWYTSCSCVVCSCCCASFRDILGALV